MVSCDHRKTRDVCVRESVHSQHVIPDHSRGIERSVVCVIRWESGKDNRSRPVNCVFVCLPICSLCQVQAMTPSQLCGWSALGGTSGM